MSCGDRKRGGSHIGPKAMVKCLVYSTKSNQKPYMYIYYGNIRVLM